MFWIFLMGTVVISLATSFWHQLFSVHLPKFFVLICFFDCSFCSWRSANRVRNLRNVNLSNIRRTCFFLPSDSGALPLLDPAYVHIPFVSLHMLLRVVSTAWLLSSRWTYGAFTLRSLQFSRRDDFIERYCVRIQIPSQGVSRSLGASHKIWMRKRDGEGCSSFFLPSFVSCDSYIPIHP